MEDNGKESIYLDSLTFDDINNFVREKFQGQKCPLCGSTKQPSSIGINGRVVFTNLNGMDPEGNNVYGSIPVIPLLCENCGHLTNLSPSILLHELEKKRQ
ncbi:hypothetical protein AB0485_002168 [Vibrio parahaemolyticus]